MPIDNLGKMHFTDQQIQNINEGLDMIIKTLNDFPVNLNPYERLTAL
jgi:hypothetical protein